MLAVPDSNPDAGEWWYIPEMLIKIILIDCFLGGGNTFLETYQSWYIPKIFKNNSDSSVAKKKTFLENNKLNWNEIPDN
jgi:hypothetical protein